MDLSNIKSVMVSTWILCFYYLVIITPAKGNISLSVCKRDYAKSTRLIFTELYKIMDYC